MTKSPQSKVFCWVFINFFLIKRERTPEKCPSFKMSIEVSGNSEVTDFAI